MLRSRNWIALLTCAAVLVAPKLAFADDAQFGTYDPQALTLTEEDYAQIEELVEIYFSEYDGDLSTGISPSQQALANAATMIVLNTGIILSDPMAGAVTAQPPPHPPSPPPSEFEAPLP